MHNIPSPDFLRGIQANLKSMLPEGLIVEDRCLTNIVFQHDIQSYDRLFKQLAEYDEGKGYGEKNGVRAQISKFFLECFSYQDTRETQTEIYKRAYRFCEAWNLSDLQGFPSIFTK